MINNKNKTSCPKVKNACKYCREQVTPKNGLQCQGACKKWAHYKCLDYTPGRISDIKAGLIKVICPCPDCDTSQAREFLVNPSYSCSISKCPANYKGGPPACELEECPEFKIKGCTKKQCVNDTNHPRMAPINPPTSASPLPPPSPPSPPVRSKSKTNTKTQQIKRVIPVTSSHACVNEDCQNLNQNLNSDSSNSDDESNPKVQASMVNALQEMCGTVGKLSIQIKELMGKVNKMA